MPNPICPFAHYIPGADSYENDSRLLSPRTLTIHVTEGLGEGLISLGATRHHNTPGTFNFLTMQDGRLFQFYPFDVRCSHAAGANYGGPGNEHEGFTGQPRPAAQLATSGKLMAWAIAEWGITESYQASDPRVWVDQVRSFRGFVAHRAVDYPPDRSLLHYDLITPFEWHTALAGVPSPPGPIPTPGVRGKAKAMTGIFFPGQGWFLWVPSFSLLPCTETEFKELVATGMPWFQIAPGREPFFASIYQEIIGLRTAIGVK